MRFSFFFFFFSRPGAALGDVDFFSDGRLSLTDTSPCFSCPTVAGAGDGDLLLTLNYSSTFNHKYLAQPHPTCFNKWKHLAEGDSYQRKKNRKQYKNITLNTINTA